MERKTLLIGPAMAITLVAMSVVASDVEAAARAGAAPISCESAAEFLEPVSPSPRDVVVFDRVAIPRGLADNGLASFTGRPARLKFWLKAGLLVRRHGTPLGPAPRAIKPVEITVPREWRNRAAIGWGDAGVSSTVRITGCRSTTPWVVFTGGYYVRSAACVPLIVRIGDRSRRIRVAVGRPC
jgi:hypothetical protein